jgi:hypothetical protein
MINNHEFAEKNNHGIISLDFAKQHEEWGIGKVIDVDAKLIAAEKWQEMIGLTQNDGLERGVNVSLIGRKILTTKIKESLKKDRYDSPLLSHGLLSLLPTANDLANIHTHYISQENSHMLTTVISDDDINSFGCNASVKALIAIDRGGVHMLVREPHIYRSNKSWEEIKVVENALEKTKLGGNTRTEFIKEVAKSLRPFGIKYYYSQSLISSPEGFITFKDVAYLEKLRG